MALKSACGRVLCLLFILLKIVLQNLVSSVCILVIAISAVLHSITLYISRKPSGTTYSEINQTGESAISELGAGSSTNGDYEVRPRELGSSRDSVSQRRVYPRAGMIPPEELNKEAEDFISNFRKQLKIESRMVGMEKEFNV